MVNQVILVGRVLELPEIKEVKGFKLASMVIEIDRNFNSNEKKDSVKEKFKITLWKNVAEECVEMCKPNALITVKGHLQPHNYQKDEVSPINYSCDIIAERVSFILEE